MAPRAPALYARISQDRPGDAAGVRRQEVDCRELAARRGWPDPIAFVDNDVSAYRGKRRPAYRQMLDAIKGGEVDAVVVWHLDRLHRYPKELEEFFEVCDAAGVRDLASVTGDVDLGTDDGRFMARILGAVARKESDDKARRVKRKHREMAEQGRAVGGQRPFGYEDDRVTVREPEAELIREAARRVLAGETLRSIAMDWSRREVIDRSGKPFDQSQIKRQITSWRVVGIRALRGAPVAAATWPAILDEVTHKRLRAILLNPARRTGTSAPARSYLLSGFLRCGRCDGRLVAKRNMQNKAYLCTSGAPNWGCGGIGIVAERTEQEVFEQMLAHLPLAEVAAAMVDGADADEEVRLLAEISGIEHELERIAIDHYQTKDIGREQFIAATRALEGDRDRARSALAQRQRTVNVESWSDSPDTLRAKWADPAFGLDQRRAVLAHWIDRIEILPGVPGHWTAERVSVFWLR